MYEAFGDESIGADHVAYATILVDSSRVTDAEHVIEQVKFSSGASARDVFHCRTLFSGQQRQKTAWANKTIVEIFDIYTKLLQELDGLLIRKIVTLAKKADFPTEVPGGQWEASDPSFIGPLRWNNGWEFTDKHIASVCAQGTMIPLAHWPKLENLRFWPDPDHTPIATSEGRRKFSRQLSGFVDHGRRGEEPSKIDVAYSENGKPELLQIADLIAYVAQRCAHGGTAPNDRRFKQLNQQIDAERVRFGVSSDGGFGVEVPNTVLSFKPAGDC